MTGPSQSLLYLSLKSFSQTPPPPSLRSHPFRSEAPPHHRPRQLRLRPFLLKSAQAYASLAPTVFFFFALPKAGTSYVRRDVLYVWSDWPWMLSPASAS